MTTYGTLMPDVTGRRQSSVAPVLWAGVPDQRLSGSVCPLVGAPGRRPTSMPLLLLATAARPLRLLSSHPVVAEQNWPHAPDKCRSRHTRAGGPPDEATAPQRPGSRRSSSSCAGDALVHSFDAPDVGAATRTIFAMVGTTGPVPPARGQSLPSSTAMGWLFLSHGLDRVRVTALQRAPLHRSMGPGPVAGPEVVCRARLGTPPPVVWLHGHAGDLISF